jgi:hypothetical protein
MPCTAVRLLVPSVCQIACFDIDLLLESYTFKIGRVGLKFQKKVKVEDFGDLFVNRNSGKTLTDRENPRFLLDEANRLGILYRDYFGLGKQGNHLATLNGMANYQNMLS